MAMRYDKRCKIVLNAKPDRYDPKLGRKVKQEPEVVVKACHLSPLGLDRTMEIFGSYAKNYFTCRIKGRLGLEPKELIIGSKTYKTAKRIYYRNRTDLIVEEV